MWLWLTTWTKQHIVQVVFMCTTTEKGSLFKASNSLTLSSMPAYRPAVVNIYLQARSALETDPNSGQAGTWWLTASHEHPKCPHVNVCGTLSWHDGKLCLRLTYGTWMYRAGGKFLLLCCRAFESFWFIFCFSNNSEVQFVHFGRPFSKSKKSQPSYTIITSHRPWSSEDSLHKVFTQNKCQ